MSKPKHLPKSPKKPPPCELQARRMQLPPHKREPCAPLPRCDYVGRTLTFTPRSGLGNALLSFASFAALANLTDRHLAVRWARGQNPSSQASFADLFVPLLRACFFVSEKESKSTSIVYFRKPIWNAIR